jgi:hypothetical protein
MIIYLEHPEHGRKVANMEAEATYDESNGWKRYNPDTPVVAAPVNELETRRKPTRKEVST